MLKEIKLKKVALMKIPTMVLVKRKPKKQYLVAATLSYHIVFEDLNFHRNSL